MSDAALIGRDKRLLWARPGSRHDRQVRAARVALPSAVGALAAILVIAPLANRAEVSFVLKKDGVAMAPERMRVTQAQYRGQDDKGQPFVLIAGSAVQATSKVPTVRLGDLSARLATDAGPSILAASTARYDLDSEKLLIDGPLTFEAPDGYRIATSDVAADLNSRKLSSTAPVSGQLPIGSFSAGQLSADLNTRTVTLSGGARLRIVQRDGK